MRMSAGHILTSQAGSLPRPDDLIEANSAREGGEMADEQRFQEQQEDHARNVELREAAELASNDLVGEVNSIKALLAESEAKAEQDRGYFAEEAKRLAGVADRPSVSNSSNRSA